MDSRARSRAGERGREVDGVERRCDKWRDRGLEGSGTEWRGGAGTWLGAARPGVSVDSSRHQRRRLRRFQRGIAQQGQQDDGVATGEGFGSRGGLRVGWVHRQGTLEQREDDLLLRAWRRTVGRRRPDLSGDARWYVVFFRIPDRALVP